MSGASAQPLAERALQLLLQNDKERLRILDGYKIIKVENILIG